MSGPPQEKEWPLEVYRRVSSGWEKQVPMSHDEENHQVPLGPNATGAPKAGCIVIKRFRLRIALASPASEEQKTGGGDKRQQKKENGKGLLEVVRRRDCLLLSSRNRFRALLLKFPSVRDCLEFSDELVLLNRGLRVTPMHVPGPSETTKNEGSKAKMTFKAMVLSDEESSSNDQDNADLCPDPVAVEIQRNEIESQIVRLLFDKNFQSTTQKLQEVIQNNPSLGNLMAATHLQTQASRRETFFRKCTSSDDLSDVQCSSSIYSIPCRAL